MSLPLLPISAHGVDINFKGLMTLMTRVATVRKKIWKMKFFPGQGKVREFCGWSGKFRKNLESQGKVREFKNKWLWQADLRKFIYSVQVGKIGTSS